VACLRRRTEESKDRQRKLLEIREIGKASRISTVTSVSRSPTRSPACGKYLHDIREVVDAGAKAAGCSPREPAGDHEIPVFLQPGLPDSRDILTELNAKAPPVALTDK
jgi:hypothetical protein